MRVFISGQKHFGALVFNLCKTMGLDIAGVSAPAFASDGKREDRLRAVARNAGIPWMPAGTLKADTLPDDIDLIIAAHSHDFLGTRTRLKARLGAIGFHPSLLPLHRGRDAVRWAIKMGDRITGGSIYWLTDNVDAGPIAAQDWCFIRPDDTPEELWRRELCPMGVRLFQHVLDDLVGGLVVQIKQDEKLATWEPAFDREPLYRPDLLMIGNGKASDYRVTVDPEKRKNRVGPKGHALPL